MVLLRVPNIKFGNGVSPKFATCHFQLATKNKETPRGEFLLFFLNLIKHCVYFEDLFF